MERADYDMITQVDIDQFQQCMRSLTSTVFANAAQRHPPENWDEIKQEMIDLIASTLLTEAAMLSFTLDESNEPERFSPEFIRELFGRGVIAIDSRMDLMAHDEFLNDLAEEAHSILMRVNRKVDYDSQDPLDPDDPTRRN